MSKMDILLNELRGMKNTGNTVHNTRDVWERIGNKDWSGVGFASEEEAVQWLEKNEYSNLA